jgi:uncharacterized protein YqgV (UPF0045/DUF77 family)
MTDKKEVKIEFAPGCFDNFEGTQEELDEMVAEIHRMFEDGGLEEHSREIDIDELIEQDPEVAEKIFKALQGDDEPRTLQ